MGLKRRYGSGKILRATGGGLAGNANCCCNNDCCATWDPPRTLYLSLDSLILDDGETCGGLCDALAKSALASLDANVLTNGGTATWQEDYPGANATQVGTVTIECDEGKLLLSTDGISVIGDNEFSDICSITFPPNPDFGSTNVFELTGFTCDPFYWEGDVPINLFADAFGAYCTTATGTMHVTITE